MNIDLLIERYKDRKKHYENDTFNEIGVFRTINNAKASVLEYVIEDLEILKREAK